MNSLDRLAGPLVETFDTKELLRGRLVVFYGYFAFLSGLAAVLGWFRAAGMLLHAVQTAHALTVGLVYLALRLLVRDEQTRWLQSLDVIATVATAMTAAVGLSTVTNLLTADVSAVAFFVLFFVVRAALVPSKPWVSAAIAAVSSLPFSFGLWMMYQHAGASDAAFATAASVRSMAAGIVGVWVVSRTIYGLRTAVEKAVRLGQYEIHEKIGEGGMGSVYRASHAMLKRPTAVKVISSEHASTNAASRFEREALATSRLTHPNNVAVYDFGRTRHGVFYYAMELLDGEDLAKLVAREGPQSAERTVHVLRQLAAALAEAHDAGLVHRDVKPQNVMLCSRGGVGDFVKVLDFGLVKDLGAPTDLKLTSDRAITGTPLYMAPEAVSAPEAVGPAADVYGVGCVAYFLLTGRAPFEGKNLLAVFADHANTSPVAPSQRIPTIPADLSALVLRCLEKAPDARPTARELGAALSDSAPYFPRAPA